MKRLTDSCERYPVLWFAAWLPAGIAIVCGGGTLRAQTPACGASVASSRDPVGTTTPAPTSHFSVHPSRRYFQDASGKPVFLLGYYTWASVDPSTTVGWPTRYADMMNEGAAYKLNYIRISLGINKRVNNPTPFSYAGGKADLDQTDATFWSGLRYHLDLARDKGFFAHVAVYEGVTLRGSLDYQWPGSFWNPVNQARTFYPDVDLDHDNNIDEPDNFYRTADFTAAAGIGKYQRKIVERAILEMRNYPNAFFEIGNELFGSDSTWNRAVYDFIKARTNHAVTQNHGGIASQVDGYSVHESNTSLALKGSLPSLVGRGYPAWEDPDGPDLKFAGADENRRAAWYSFAGGGAGYAGFTTELNRGVFNTTQTGYYKNLMDFIEESGVRFWEMTPQHSLVSGGIVENSVLAETNSQYVVYVRDDASVTLDLAGLTRAATYRHYCPKTGAWGTRAPITGGGARTFGRPTGAEDWVVFIQVDDTPWPTPEPEPEPTRGAGGGLGPAVWRGAPPLSPR
ncbi:MAG: hypothetical protein ACREOF_10855 [Gemmatimonadales bacterium]